MTKILFLCHGNICRSPMAEFVMKDLLAKAGRTDVEVASAALHPDNIRHDGSGADVHSGTRRTLRLHGVPFTSRQAWLLTPAKAREYDLLIGMDRFNRADLMRLVYPEDRGKIHLLLEYAGRDGGEVADPWYTGDFEATWNDVLSGCEGLLSSLV